MKDPVDIGSRRELFVDDGVIEKLRGLTLRLHAPERREVVLEMDAPWEGPVSAYYHVFQDGGRVRLYYRGCYLPQVSGGSEEQTANLAESADGIHFTRPTLGLIEFQGSKDNNVVYRGPEAHNLFVFRDENPAAPPEERYKAVGGVWEKLYGFASPDGIRWRKVQPEPLGIPGKFDSLNVVFWDRLIGQYRMFSRFWDGVRAIQSATSEDFIHWSRPVPNDYGADAEKEEYYTNATIPCPGAEHILLSFPKRFVPQRTKGTEGMAYPGEGVSDTVFMTSRDGVRWRRFREAWVRPGLDERNWTHRSNMVAWGIIPTSEREWSLYISEHYGWATNRLRRLTVRPHGFVSAHADYAGGELLTQPVVFSGRTLRINCSTSAAGSVGVEMRSASGRALKGFTLADMPPLFGDELDAPVCWKGGPDISPWAGKPVRFRFVLKDADLFALRVAAE